ncbi:MAG: hypothetical protein ACI8PZ_007021 [Myxococcota bacterium]
MDDRTRSDWWTDADGDGFGEEGPPVRVCIAPGVDISGDCDDDDPAVHPDAPEMCNAGIDDDCNDLADDADPGLDPLSATPWYPDADGDGDGFAGDAEVVYACEAPPGTAAESTDCDDTRPGVYPGAMEVCDGVPNDCDAGLAEEPRVATFFYDDDDLPPQDATDALDRVTAYGMSRNGRLALCPGVWTGDLLSWSDELVIEGIADDPADVVFDAEGAHKVVLLEEPPSRLEVRGLTLRNGDGGSGAAALNVLGFGAEVVLDRVRFEDNHGGVYGGAVRQQYGTLTIRDCHFDGNDAYNGGAVYVYNAEVSISDSTFVENTADLGGALYFSETEVIASGLSFTENWAEIGGAIALSGGTLDASDLTSWGNVATDSAGLWSLTDGAVGTLDGGLLQWDSAAGDGGMFALDGGSLVVTDTTIRSGVATRGGAAWVGAGAELELGAGTTVSDGRSTVSGGAVYVADGTARCVGGAILRNTSDDDGGGIYLDWAGHFEALRCDLGDGLDTNLPHDVYLPYGPVDYGADATAVCDAFACL